MTHDIRVLISASPSSARESLLTLLGQMEDLLVIELCESHTNALQRFMEVRPTLTIAIEDDRGGEALQLGQNLLKLEETVPFLLISSSAKIQSSLNFQEGWPFEVMALPLEAETLHAEIQKLTASRQRATMFEAETIKSENADVPRSPVQTVALAGATGEVGCSSVAVNLATTLAKLTAKEVVLADFEIMFGTLDTRLDLRPEKTLIDVVQSVDRLDSTLLKRMLTRHESGLYVLPRPTDLQDGAKIDPESLVHTVDLLKASFAAVLLDLSKNLQNSDFVGFDAANVILVVMQLEPISIRNTAKLIQCLHDFGDYAQRIQVVANRVGSLRGSVPLHEAEATLGQPILWQIPNESKVFNLARIRGCPINMVSRKNNAQHVFNDLASTLFPHLMNAPKPPRKSFRDRFRREE